MCVMPGDLKKSLWEQFRGAMFQMKMLIWWTLLGVGFGLVCGLSLYRSHLPPLAIELIGKPMPYLKVLLKRALITVECSLWHICEENKKTAIRML